MASDDFDLIIGIDFGTTGSGVAYRFNEPGARTTALLANDKYLSERATGDFNSKIPTILAYVEENPNRESTAWGFEADNHSYLLAAWFKLFFQKRIDMTKWGSADQDWAFSRGIMHLPDGKEPREIVSDFLRYLFEYIWSAMEPKLTQKHKYRNTTKIKFCFTVPVVWSLEAKSEMSSAIEKAGFGSREGDSVCFLTEAEAAMTFLLSKWRRLSSSHDSQSEIFKPGNRVIICDCGGGTVDIASYLIVNEDNQYEELASGSGGICGSTLVDREFYRLMVRRFGRLFSDLPLQHIGPKSSFMKEFESVKHSFTGSDRSQSYKLYLEMLLDEVPDTNWYDQERCQVLLSSADLQWIFQEVVKEIIGLLEAQIQKTNSTAGHAPVEAYKILLVGGFACSPYLKAELKRAFELDLPHGKSAMIYYVYGNMFTAVTLGAVEWVTGDYRSKSLITTCHYGVRGSVPMDLLHDQGVLSIREISNSDHYMNNQGAPIDWIIRKDQKLQLGIPVRHNGSLLHRMGDSVNKTVNIYGSDQEEPPTTQASEPGAFVLARITFDISQIDSSRCQSYEIEGRMTWHIDYRISVELAECGTKLRFAVSWQDTELAHWVGSRGIIGSRV